MRFAEFKRKMGLRRDRLLYGRRDRRLREAAANAEREWVGRAFDSLPPLSRASHKAVEVHTLCGEKQSMMGMWASYSLLRFLPDAQLVVHCDGSLSDVTRARWARAVPGLRIVERNHGFAHMAEVLSGYPEVVDWTRRYHFGQKLGVYYTALEADVMIDLDTDVLAISDPTSIKEATRQPAPQMRWNRDLRFAYSYSDSLLRDVLGDLFLPLPDRLNGGFMVSFRFGNAEWALLEAALKRLRDDPRTDHLRYWMHQTLLALVASHVGPERAYALPEGYDIHQGPTRENATARHYVGSSGIRPRFFTEGVPAVIRDARNRGQLPRDFFIREVP